MTYLNNRTARMIDPVLSTVARGYKHADRIGRRLLPAVPVKNRGGQVIEFGKESFIDYRAKRAPGADTKQIQIGYEGKPFILDSYSLDGVVPREHAQEAEVPGVDLGARATNTVMMSLTLSLEIEQATLVTTDANYPTNNKLALAGASKWSDVASSPMEDIDAAKAIVRGTCGSDPNRMAISYAGFKALRKHPKIVERFKYVSSESITSAMLANIFDLEELAVGKATYWDDDGVAGSEGWKEVWGNNAVLAYVPRDEELAIDNPAFGYTYTLEGMPHVETPYFKDSNKSWIYGVTYERKPVIAGNGAGFLFKGIV